MKQNLRTPLALSILSLLLERPMHPYEMRTLMTRRGHDRVVKLKGSSLYSTIDRLAAGMIRAVETSRAELAWIRQTIGEIRNGDLVWPAEVLALQQRTAMDEMKEVSPCKPSNQRLPRSQPQPGRRNPPSRRSRWSRPTRATCAPSTA